ncbi:hypothetical protein P879_01710 [Paragonimus westermani]|uniref:Uncharacterized protein n=1 Tax=Paragonimus westermani TaxID=34504 RepID=A0A8T0DEM9_9TREM|nr:hypothetical protein P879_01710 [Paragonimus westermani]
MAAQAPLGARRDKLAHCWLRTTGRLTVILGAFPFAVARYFDSLSPQLSGSRVLKLLEVFSTCEDMAWYMYHKIPKLASGQ